MKTVIMAEQSLKEKAINESDGLSIQAIIL